MRGESASDAVWERGVPDLAVHDCTLYNPFTCSWEEASFAIRSGHIWTLERVPAKRVLELKKACVIPGFIDAHVHIESSMLTPSEFGRLALRHGTTTVIADPHEIANVLGIAGLDYMLSERRRAPIDIFYMLPSSVPASDQDIGGATLASKDLMGFRRRKGVIGLGEVMNAGAVLREEEDLISKIRGFRLVDGHAPLLKGAELDAYIRAGIQSDHESISGEEAMEKLRRGMYIFAREGTAEKNLKELVPLVRACSIPRWCFATDDRTAEMLYREGGIDDCVRKAIALGCEPELALRMATLSPAERFGLTDRGAIAPGRLADFCILSDEKELRITKVFKRGTEIAEIPRKKPRVVRHALEVRIPRQHELAIPGKGRAHVLGLVRGQIVTDHLVFDTGEASLPDLDRDILKAVVCNRYGKGRFGIGLVHGFGIERGAIGSSVSHDAHNIVAVGADDRSLIAVISEIFKAGGGLAVVDGGHRKVLPLECAGLMSGKRFEEFVPAYMDIVDEAESLCAVRDAFMYLSFITLTVIPRLRITDSGLFDAERRRYIPIFMQEE